MVIRLSETIRRQKFKWYLYFQNIFEMTSNPGKQLVAVAASFRVNTSGLFETPGKIWFLNSLGPFAGAQPHTRRGGGTPGRRDPGYWVSRLGIMVIYTVYLFFIDLYMYTVYIIHLLTCKRNTYTCRNIQIYLSMVMYFFYTFLKVKNTFAIPFSSSVVVMFPINIYVC